MRHLIYATTAAMAAFLMSGTAQAGEIRIEGHAGVSGQGNGSTKATVGAALGYDAAVGALGNGVFAGVEESVDRSAGGSGTRWGTSGRLGIKVLSLGALYGVAGYHYGSGPNAASVGAGYQQGLGPVYGKVEYRHYMNEGGWRPADAVTLGFGVKF
ncbi:hypothetical protein [Novosphingobium humi]|uniref:Outer membrane protein beta-barrel domain-containing protein n=1 Tax=Novosphingobium humi TaxID=2282397 RepID=A0ABY7TT75_9SPHN|nr:hypothetical protein [Novosphingobium humi]WCT76413.1 hypothetical protein PQ457_10710 [Novosphingobium humi]